jgi:hypothetical protein
VSVILGFKQDVSLTGFKWIGNMADDLKREGKTVILMWEEVGCEI